MGVIAEAIEKLMAEYIRDRGLVLWFDPERHYENIAAQVRAGQSRTLVFEGSFYKLRLEAEPLLRGDHAPHLLVYLPIPWEKAEEPLAEMLALGVDLRPGRSGSRNTGLAILARKALRGRVAEALLADLDKQVKQGSITLTELEALADEGVGGPLPTKLAVHFGSAHIDDAVLDFLARPDRDSELLARNGLEDWAAALHTSFGLTGKAKSPAELRGRLARLVLTSELVESLGDDLPDSLRSLLSMAHSGSARRAADVAKEWRNRRDIAPAYPPVAADVAKALHLDSIEFSDAALERVETFLSLEQRLLQNVAARIPKQAAALNIAETRQRGFWSLQNTGLQAEWSLVAQAGQLLAKATEVEQCLRSREYSWSELVDHYTGETNWAHLDTLQRRLERRASSLEFALVNRAEEVEQLVHTVRRRHQEVAGELAEKFVRAWKAQGFSIGERRRQSEIYDQLVAPEVARHRTAYILVDALRWELAQELPDVLGVDFDTKLEIAIGTAPSVTEVGMAALLPGASTGLELGTVAKWQVSLHGKVLKNRADRISYLKEKVSVTVTDLKLEDPRGFKRKLKDLDDGPALIFVTSREIDQSGEEEMSAAREHMGRVLTHLGLAMRRLAEEGVERFIVTADHGFLYGEDLADSEKIDPPGGKTLLAHRRVWAGQGAAASPSYLLTDVSRFGAKSDLEMAVPWNLAGFKTAGPLAYFHGGLSPQEIILPVLTITPKNVRAAKASKKVTWEISLGSAKITTRFFSVRIQGRALGLFAETWPNVRIEVRTGADVCAMPTTSSYGFQEATGAVALLPSDADPSATEVNSVALMLTGKTPSRGTVSIHLLDAATGVELKKLESVEVSLAI